MDGLVGLCAHYDAYFILPTIVLKDFDFELVSFYKGNILACNDLCKNTLVWCLCAKVVYQLTIDDDVVGDFGCYLKVFR